MEKQTESTEDEKIPPERRRACRTNELVGARAGRELGPRVGG